MIRTIKRNIKKKSYAVIWAELILPILLLLLLLLLNMGNVLNAAKSNEVTQGEFVQTALLTGSLKARKAERFIVPRTNSWQIQIKWMAREGDMIKVGDPVVRFDTSNLVADIENLEMTLQQKEEAKLQKKADLNHQTFEVGVKLKQAEIDYKKKGIDASIPKGLESNFKYDEKKLDLKRGQQAYNNAMLEKNIKLASLNSELKKLDLEIEEARQKLQKSLGLLKSLILTAKTTGTLVYGEHEWENRKIQVGDNVMATWTVATIPDNTSLEIEAWANETGIRNIKTGQKVNISLDAYPNRKYTGIVKDVLNSAEKRPHWGKAHYFCVSISMDSRDMSIMKPGMSIKCQVQVAQHKDVLLVPLQMVGFQHQKFHIKAKGNEPVTVTPLGYNAFYLALSRKEADSKGIKNGLALEPVSTAEMQETPKEMTND